MVKTLDSNKARAQWRTLLDETAAGKTSYVITRYGKPILAVIPFEDYLLVQDRVKRKSHKSRNDMRVHKTYQRIEDHPFFGSRVDDTRSVEEIMDELRGGRFRDL